ncbi:MAG: hypothetical protein ABRQ39_31230 [Candidatus Eremiobacterota bacterium]
MNIYEFLKSMEDFFAERIDKQAILNHLKNFKDEFITMVTENKYGEKYEKDIMEKSMDVINNIYILLDDDKPIPDDELKMHVDTLIKLHLFPCVTGTGSEEAGASEKNSSEGERDDFMEDFSLFASDVSSEKISSEGEADDFMNDFSLFASDVSSEKVSSEGETDDFMNDFSLFDSDVSSEKISSEGETETLELDMVEELIKNVAKSASKDDFITENYINIKKNALLFLTDRTDREKFEKMLMDIKHRVIKTRKEYEKSYLLENEWTVESAAGDRLLIEGMNDYEKGLTFLKDNLDEKNEEKIKAAIDMIYEANKKLVLNQCLVKYVENIISMRDKMSLLKRFLKA